MKKKINKKTFLENYEPIGVDEIEKAELEEVSKEDDPETVPEKPDNTGYQMFTRFARMKLRKTRPDLHFGQINHHLAKLWKKEQIKEVKKKKFTSFLKSLINFRRNGKKNML